MCPVRWRAFGTVTCGIPLAYKEGPWSAGEGEGPQSSTLAHLDLGFILGGLLGVPWVPSRGITDLAHEYLESKDDTIVLQPLINTIKQAGRRVLRGNVA